MNSNNAFNNEDSNANINSEKDLKSEALNRLRNKVFNRETLFTDQQKLIEELQIHQIELEMQNDELINKQLLVEETKQKYIDLYDFAPIGYLTLDEDKRIVELNLTATQMFNSEKSFLLDKPFNIFVDQISYTTFNNHINNVLNSQKKHTCELKLKTEDTLPTYIRMDSVMFYGNNDEKYIRIAVIDITKQRIIEDELKESEARYKAVIDDQSELIFRTTPDGIISFVNDSYCNYFNKSKGELIGTKSRLERDINDEYDKIKIIDKKENKNEVVFETKIISPNGEESWHRWTKRGIYKDGKLIEYQFVGRNITAVNNAQEQYRKSRERLKLALKSARIGWWEWDYDTRTVTYSPEKAEMIGYSVDEFPNTDTEIMEYVHPEDYEKTMKAMRDHLTGKTKVYEIKYRIRTKDGDYRWYYDKGSIVERNENGTIKKLIGTVQDITEMVEHEEKIKEQKETIEKQASKLEEINKNLENINEELKQYAHIVSHDLKSPLTSVISFINIIERKYLDLFDEFGKEITSEAKNRVYRMVGMIEGLLKYSGLLNKNSALEMNDMNNILKEAIDNLSTKIQSKNAEIEAENLPNLYCDKMQMISLLQNLIDNAVKYSKDKPLIKISVEETQEKNRKMYLFSVKDNGIGLKPKYKDKIFLIFNRVDKTNNDSYGIGLSVCKKIVEAHGGKIWVESEGENMGTTFKFTIKKYHENYVGN